MVRFSQIQEFAQKIGRAYHPQQVILFGSHAREAAGEDSDVDLLVVLPFEGKSIRKAVEMRLKLRPPFPVDLLVRTPETIRSRLEMGDFFIREIMEEGKVVYETDYN